ncbi:hypothetical protein BD289DRAFT_483525 [Coniella lustricola]|uniref:FAD-binding domain-containing protein n=1 Tax=Coniella lustricola TaxID=2025994 RepID=A0A2T3A548_9PEZI|nr:hypothetical protein BD289DRAFT_483525 [Coniella lustricola]
MEPHILIIGAGPGGLALAQGLKRNGINFTVFERDSFLDSRRQGYRLKLVGDIVAGLQATVTPEAWEVVQATSANVRLGETNLNATDASITACRKQRLPPGVDAPLAADRGLLRRALMEGVQNHVKFGKKLVSYRIISHNNTEKVETTFEDGSTAEGTLLVGADGSRSAVRAQLLPAHKFLDTGVCCVYGKSSLNGELLSRFPEKHRRWMTVVRDQTPIIQSIITRADSPVTMVCEPCHFSNRERFSQIPEDYVHFGIMFPRSFFGPHLSDEEVDQKLRSDPRGISLDITSEWDPSVRSLIELQESDLTYGMRILSAPEVIPAWQESHLVTALGDAVHLMSPAGGVGAVSALNDAVLLTRIIATEGISAESIRKFEDGMRAFAAACIGRSKLAGSKMLGLSNT